MSRWITTTALLVMTTLRFPVFAKEANKAVGFPTIAGFWTLNTDLSDVVTHRGVELWTEKMPDLAGASALLCELSEPTAYLTIVPGEGTVTFVDGDGNPRTFGTSGQTEKHHLGAGTVEATSRWHHDELRQEWSLPGGLHIIRTFAPAPDQDQLIVTISVQRPSQTEFASLKRVYLSDVVR